MGAPSRQGAFLPRRRVLARPDLFEHCLEYGLCTKRELWKGDVVWCMSIVLVYSVQLFVFLYCLCGSISLLHNSFVLQLLVGNMKIIESCGITDFTFCFFYLLLLVRVEEYMPNGPRKRK